MFQHLILRFLLSFCTLGFAAGTVVLGDGGGGADAGAVADGAADDAGAGDGAADGTGDGSDGAADGAQGDDATAGDGTDEQQITDKPGDEKIDWRTVPQAVRNHLNELKKTDPKLANLVQNAVYTSQSFLRHFPGGIKEVQALKQVIDDAGGAEEIQTMRETHRAVVEEQEDLDRRAAAGDISVLDNLVEIAGDGGFSKLMPSALDRWMQKAPAEYSHTMGQIIVSALQEGGVVSDLRMAMQLFSLNTPESIKLGNDSLNKAVGYLNSINEIATKTPEKPKVDPQIAQQQQQIDSERTKIFNDRFSDRFVSWRNPEILKNLSELSPKGKQFSDTQRSFFVRGVVEHIKNVLSADSDYNKSLERIYNTRNVEDLLKFTKSRAEKLLPEAAKKVYRELFTETTLGGKKPAQQVAKPGQQPLKPGAQPGNQPQNKGWLKVSADKAPKPDDIDNKKTDFGMKFKKAAILKSGQKVYWGERPPA